MAKDMTKIEVQTNPRFKIHRVAFVTAMLTIPAGIGIWADSVAMQWLGFVWSSISVFAAGAVFAKSKTGLTIQQARALLDEIEAGEIGK